MIHVGEWYYDTSGLAEVFMVGKLDNGTYEGLYLEDLVLTGWYFDANEVEKGVLIPLETH